MAVPALDETRDRALPTFFVVGAAKAGTTALHHYLAAHPGVFLPAREEPSFFAFEGQELHFRGPDGSEASVNRTAVTRLEDYLDLYAGAGPGQRRGDVSPVYLYWPGTAARIRRAVPAARICVILRNPADRAYSAYMHARREGKEPLDFAAALRAEPARIADGWGFLWRYADLGRYAGQLEAYYTAFPPEQIRVVQFDDLQDDAEAVVADLQRFVGLDGDVAADVSVRYNLSGVPRSRLAHTLTGTAGPLRPVAGLVAPILGRERLRRWAERLRARNLRKEPVPEAARRALLESFEDDIERTARLTGLDLGRWLATTRR